MLFLDKHEHVKQKEHKLYEDVNTFDMFNALLECAFISNDIVHLEHYNTVNGILTEGVETGIFTRIWEAIKKVIKKCISYVSKFLSYVKSKFTNMVVLIPPAVSKCIIEINDIINKLYSFADKSTTSRIDINYIESRTSHLKETVDNLSTLRKYKAVTGSDVKESISGLQETLNTLNSMYEASNISFDSLDTAKKFNNNINTLISMVIKITSYLRETLATPVKS